MNLVAVINAGWTPPVDLNQPKYASRGVQWYKAVRMEYIGFVLQASDEIFPQELVNRFGITTTQARQDIKKWQEINEKKLYERPSEKKYGIVYYTLTVKKRPAVTDIKNQATILERRAGA